MAPERPNSYRDKAAEDAVRVWGADAGARFRAWQEGGKLTDGPSVDEIAAALRDGRDVGGLEAPAAAIFRALSPPEPDVAAATREATLDAIGAQRGPPTPAARAAGPRPARRPPPRQRTFDDLEDADTEGRAPEWR